MCVQGLTCNINSMNNGPPVYACNASVRQINCEHVSQNNGLKYIEQAILFKQYPLICLGEFDWQIRAYFCSYKVNFY